MIRNYFKIAWRNLKRNKVFSSFINIIGLVLGMSVVLLTGLWIHDELTFNKVHDNYGHIAQVLVNKTAGGKTRTLPPPFAISVRR